jgi:carnitine O-acetyltransferase
LVVVTDDYQNREKLKSVPDNEKYLHVLEAAAFIVCLDDASPEGAPERARHFHFGDGRNRWNDKSIQFVICENTVSGIVGDHSMLDASTLLGLNKYVYKAIQQHQNIFSDDTTIGEVLNLIHEVKPVVLPEIEDEITRMQADFARNTRGVAHAFFTYTVCGAA